jgi:hypothetical protein
MRVRRQRPTRIAGLSAGDCYFYDMGRWELYVATCGVVVLDRPDYILS